MGWSSASWCRREVQFQVGDGQIIYHEPSKPWLGCDIGGAIMVATNDVLFSLLNEERFTPKKSSRLTGGNLSVRVEHLPAAQTWRLGDDKNTQHDSPPIENLTNSFFSAVFVTVCFFFRWKIQAFLKKPGKSDHPWNQQQQLLGSSPRNQSRSGWPKNLIAGSMAVSGLERYGVGRS